MNGYHGLEIRVDDPSKYLNAILKLSLCASFSNTHQFNQYYCLELEPDG